jgi:hypothetical protein
MESFKNKVQCGTVYHEKLGYDLTAIIELTAVKSKITEVERHISRLISKCLCGILHYRITDMIINIEINKR